MTLFAMSMLASDVHAAPVLQASASPEVAPLYTPRDKMVPLTGSGYSAGQTYYVWVRKPGDNTTRYSGASFTPISGGLIPPGFGLPIPPNATLGTYLVSVSTSPTYDNQQATAHYGIWGARKPLYQRTESVIIMGGGLFPGTSFTLSIRSPADDYIQTSTLVSTIAGDFNASWKIPADATTGTYKVIIDGTGTFDEAGQDYLSESRFTVTQATLAVEVAEQPAQSYQRTEVARSVFLIRYPDGKPVIKSKSDIRPVALQRNQSTVALASITLLDEASGMWLVESKIRVNATPSSRYRFVMTAMSFDDGYGNKGGAVDTYSDYFAVTNASFQFSSKVNGTQIQVPFGQVSILSKITYPDGSLLSNGTVRVLVSTGTGTFNLESVFDATEGAWRTAYSSSIADLWSVGTWILTVEAFDIYGNTGVATYEIAAQPYLFLIIIGIVVVAVIIGRWTFTRYGRRTYLRLRKTLHKLRGGRRSL